MFIENQNYICLQAKDAWLSEIKIAVTHISFIVLIRPDKNFTVL